MANIDKHAPGDFCWIELATTDQTAATGFYSKIFGWTFKDYPIGPNEVYTVFQVQERDAAAGCRLRLDQLSRGIPPHWNLYVAIESADATAARAEQLGGKVLAPPFDVFDAGRMAVLQDPTGAALSLWQAINHRGTGITAPHGTLCWADLNSRDPEKASKFYGDWLGWKFETGKDGYKHIMNGEGQHDMIGGIPPQMHAPPGTPSHWLPYFHVVDCKASAAKAAQLGASTMMPAQLMQDVGTIAVLADPQGAVFALYQPIARS